MSNTGNVLYPKDEALCPPLPPQRPAEMTAESKNGFGKHDVRQNVQLLLTECTAQTFLSPACKAPCQHMLGKQGRSQRAWQDSRQLSSPKCFHFYQFFDLGFSFDFQVFVNRKMDTEKSPSSGCFSIQFIKQLVIKKESCVSNVLGE